MPIADGHVLLGLEPGGVLSEEVNGDRIYLAGTVRYILEEGLECVDA